MIYQRSRLLVAPLIALAADATVTLRGQSSAYWSGRYDLANEAEVIGAMALRIHPAAFVAWIVIWATTIVSLIVLMPRGIARTICVAAAMLHTFGVLNWVWTGSFAFPYLAYACGVGSAALIVYSLEPGPARRV